MHYMSSTLDHNLTCVVPHTYSNVCVVHIMIKHLKMIKDVGITSKKRERTR